MPARAYPRPQFRRASWTSLDGPWSFALDVDGRWSRPNQVGWQGTIEVPFAPETERSGIRNMSMFVGCWYRRSFVAPTLTGGARATMHFGAVDYRASVWIDGALALRHEGGYTPFRVDVTELLRSDAQHEVVVQAEDDPADLEKPRGKQDWQLVPHSIWYPRTSGIWQSVWLEVLPVTHIESVRMTPSLSRWEVGFDAKIQPASREGVTLSITMRVGSELLAHDVCSVVHGEVHRRIALSDRGIDDSRNSLLWSPSTPTLIDVDLVLRDPAGSILDQVKSYTALRAISVEGDLVLLNGRPYPLRLVLDQGYWPESGMTAPSDDALKKDVVLAKQMGFNGVRKHQKVEDPRYLAWADRLGLLVWSEIPSAYRFTKRSIERLTREWIEVINRDYNHPCVMAWVPFNESWGVPNLPDNAAERHYVQALYYLTKTLDPDRPVIGNDGWESVTTDIIGIHDYDPDPEFIGRRYRADDVRPRLFRRERSGGRTLLLAAKAHAEHPIVLSEFGGIKLGGKDIAPGTWGYSECVDAASFARLYSSLLDIVNSLGMLAGFCYTQFADTYQEANGLLYADRTPKIPIADIARATRGPRRWPIYESVRVVPDPEGNDG